MDSVAIGGGRKQARLTTPLRGRIRREWPNADVLVSLSSGLAGKREEHQLVAKHLGLRRWGDQVLLRARDRDRMCMANRIGHLVTITYFDSEVQVVEPLASGIVEGRITRIRGTNYCTASHEDTAAAAGVGAETANIDVEGRWPLMVRRLELLAESGLEGGYFEFENDEYLQVEVADDGASIIWSSDMSAGHIAELFEAVLGKPDPRCFGLLIEADGEAHEEASPDVLARAEARGGAVRGFSVGYPDSVVSWRHPQIKMIYGKTAHVELAVSCERVDVARVLTLIDRTATDAVKATLARDSSPLVQSLGDIVGD